MERVLTGLEQEVIPTALEMHELRSLGSLVPTDTATTTGLQPKRPRNWLFIASFIVPVFLSAIYLFAIAADRYKSEVSFIVRSTGSSNGISMSGGMAEAGGSKLSKTSEDAYIVDEYISSRDALDRLIKEKNLRDIFARPEADIFSRFPGVFFGSSKERLFEHYKSLVKSSVDDSTGISTIEVTAFRPEDAQLLARALLDYAESIVNRINERANRDRVAFAAQVVERAKDAVKSAERALTDYRTTSGIVDPKSEYKVALESISRLTTEASQREAALNQQLALTPNGPAITSLREKVRSLRDEIGRQSHLIAGKNESLAVKLGVFEQLMLDREIAVKELGNAVSSYESSLQTAGEQQLYLQTITEPNAPDWPFAPKRFLLIGLAVLCCALLYRVLKKLKEIAEEHAT